ncbi:RHO1 GDP-GTP exchange protein 2 [Cladophialophora chaetospira]|uniref:RHO1 GDP-GTP exchange protein 2 n=1 Tax=Cladophialophora chaetospira TaxID=386627 RepID=A0AA38XFV6_9EURO|nr:RHO1 GDP-GTP exchange protein 2 [Cladophialophora chaetospira]
MADYGAPESRYYGARGPPPQHGGPADQRDAAFHSIFGGAPQGRSQTMTTQSTGPMYDRSQSMLSQQQHTMSMRQGPPPIRQMPQSYDRVNGIAPGQPYMNGTHGSRPPPPPQPAPMYPERRPYPPPQRIDTRPGMPPPIQTVPYDRRPVPNRMPPPALNNDGFRSRSMVRPGEPTLSYRPPPSSFQPGTASAFRQQPYAAMGASRTTAQGRHIPDRVDSDRSMSMGSFALDRDHTQQLTSGRVVPHRRRESESDNPFADHHASPGGSFNSSNSPAAGIAPRQRRPSEGSNPPRTVSAASASSEITATTPNGSRTDSMMSSRPPTSAHSSTSTSQTIVQRKSPLVYPALLSRVATAFQERIGAGDRTKNDLTYKSAFTGAEAVDLIAYIIKTTDRNLALLLGRALDAQKFFHDVTYEHRLRDAPGEVYRFRETMGEEASSKDVNGVFTLLTECYSPTCTRDNLCYSIACPRRLEQQARLNLRPQPGLRHSNSKGSLHEDDQEQKLWINSVPKEVADKIDDKEKKRQEVISEIMYTERDFVKDLEYLRDFWIRPLRGSGSGNVNSPIKEERREKFVRTVFGNCLEVLGVNGKFAEELSKRQKEQHVVHSIGDVFLKFVPQFDPFIKYGANQMYGKYEFEKEKGSNPPFSRFVDETERLKESRKLELNGYLTKPTTRLARYPLLLDNVLKYTKDDNPDKKDIPIAIGLIKDFLARVNAESGKAENHFNLIQLNQQLKWNAGEYTDLKLTEENRVILTKMNFKKSPTDNAEVQVYLFDHAVLMCRNKTVNKREELRVYRKPIPLELLVIAEMDQIIPRLGIAKRSSSSLIPGSKTSSGTPGQKEIYPITFRHLGKGAYELQLYATSVTQRKKFIELVEEQQTKLRQRSNSFYNKTILCENYFNAQNRVNCLVPTDGGRKLIYGTDNGIYIADRWPKDKSVRPKRILDATQVSQIDTLEEYRLLLVLSNKTLTSYPFDALDPNNQNPLATRPRKIQGHANFFKAGIGLGRHLVCSVKTSALSTTIKVYEPMDDLTKGKKKPAISKMFASGQDALKPFKEFYIPAESTSVHYLRSTLCVGCARGFEVVSLETTERQSLLDQADTSLDFVTRKENVKPIHIERLNGEFLLNYSDFSFFVNRNGWRARPDWKITWEGTPQAFALNYPYILAFEPSFIEIRHIETSELIHVMTGKNVRMLHSSTREILYAYEDETGEDVIASLDFWTQAQGNGN